MKSAQASPVATVLSAPRTCVARSAASDVVAHAMLQAGAASPRGGKRSRQHGLGAGRGSSGGAAATVGKPEAACAARAFRGTNSVMAPGKVGAPNGCHE
eukprot:3137439-Alexandrium_andersonii.AAC.1